MKTYTPKAGDLEEKWFVIDADGLVLGRLASRIAMVLRGKNDPRYTPHANMHAHVVVINAEKVRLTGKKWTDKIYYRHSGWIGGIRSITAEKLLEKKPTELLRKAVWGMLPHNRLGHATMTRLRLFVGPEHEHQAQKPVALDVMVKAQN
jgi:large subunit ribosomal protein L13